MKRSLALDVFRGITIAAMIVVNNPGSWQYVYPPLRHAQWHGLTPTDLVFPFFLFAVGAAMAFSIENIHDTKAYFKKVIWRSLSLFAAGWVLMAFPFIWQNWDYSGFRYMGVLQRIAICYGVAAIIIRYTNQHQIISLCFAGLGAYWVMLYLGGDLSLAGNFVRFVDTMVLGERHLYQLEGIPFDPEGLISTIPAIITVLFGYLAGSSLKEDFTWNKIIHLFYGGLFLLILGLVWHFAFPINKKLWTSSFVLSTAGIASIVMAMLVWVTQVKAWEKPLLPFKVLGRNAIVLYFLSELWAVCMDRFQVQSMGSLTSIKAFAYETYFQPTFGDLNGSLLFALLNLLGFWLLAWWMYRRKLFVKF